MAARARLGLDLFHPLDATHFARPVSAIGCRPGFVARMEQREQRDRERERLKRRQAAAGEGG
jgi:hypothetical protein